MGGLRMNLMDLDAIAIAEQIKAGLISSIEATEIYINHISHINPKINAVVVDRFDQARIEAKQADALIKEQKTSGRLFGVPISMKESFDVVDMSTTGGLQHRVGLKASKDAAIVKKLKDEGAIILGKTNTPTLCFCQETENKLYGRTNNPWDLTRTAGGSSGGEGAIIAAGGAAVGIGADIGGSIRFPAHFNGVIGFKSGNKQVDDTGAYPPFAHPLQERMLGIGAMAKSVRDARLINEIIAHSIPPQRKLTDFEITFPIEQLNYPLSSQSNASLFKVRESIGQHFVVADERPPMFTESALLWQLIMSIDGAATVIKEAFPSGSGHPYTEWFKEKTRNNSNYHRYLTWGIIGANTFKPSRKKLQLVQEQINLGDNLIQNYLQNRLLVLPVYHSPALPHGKVYSEIFSIRKTFQKYMPFVAYANVWGLPSLTLPIGEENGLPISIQIISNNHNEDAIFQLGAMLEQSFRGWKRAIIE